MSKETKAMKLALEALEELTDTEQTYGALERGDAAITALREALAEQPALAAPVQEPVAGLSETQAKAILVLALDLEWTGRAVETAEGQVRTDFVNRNRNIQCALEDALRNATTPQTQPAREWVRLTEDEFEDIELACRSTPWGKIEAMRKVESKLKEKNT